MSDKLLHGAEALTPTAKVIVFTRAPTDPQYAKYGDRAAVVHPYVEGMRPGESMDGYLGRVVAEAVPAGATWSIIDSSALPAVEDRGAYRNARRFDHQTKTFSLDGASLREEHAEMARIAAADKSAAAARVAERQRIAATIPKEAETIAAIKKAMPL